ncbi:MAG: hypothetical protein ACOYL5_19020 [Phototrophicaceae bacterium]|jgi:NDP-sugar pyrophosphorylase family protein
MLHARDFFALDQTAHAALFDDTTYVWQALPRIGDYIRWLLDTTHPANGHTIALHPSCYIGENVHIGAGAQIAPGSYIEGPTIIGQNVQVRHGAYVRANTLAADGAIIGHATETKNAVLLEGAAAPHFSYVGDSILGARVNLGAGTKLSNFPMTVHSLNQTISLTINGESYDTGLTKFGAILGDDVDLGCNCVTNPGVLVGARTMVYTLTMLAKGYYPPDRVIKLRQTLEVADRY